MPFDPNLPQENTLVDAVQMRSQLNGLKALIDAIQTLTAAQVDGVTTLDPGLPATVNVSVTDSTLHFSFEIPRGIQGQPGLTGQMGETGPQGAPGEVTLADLSNALNVTSNNSNAVGQMSLNVDTSYNQTQVQQICDKLDELILALRR